MRSTLKGWLSLVLVLSFLTLFLQPAAAAPTPGSVSPDVSATRAAPSDVPVILLHGVMGGVLANDPLDTGECASRPEGEVWPNIWTLVLDPWEFNDDLESLWLAEDGRVPANPCDQIRAIRTFTELDLPLVGADYYQDFIDEMERAGYLVYPYAFDWRLDMEEIALQLDAFITDEVGAQQVVLVGHSMGGLVARQYAQEPERAARVAQIISVGSPYWGAPVLAMHMRAGTTPFGSLVDLLVDADVIWQLIRNAPGVMQLLPSEAYFKQVGPYYKDHGTILWSYDETLNFYDRKRQNRPLIEEARGFHRAMDDFRVNLTVPYHVLSTYHLATPARIREYTCFLFFTCWSAGNVAVGDGTVPWGSARLSGNAGDWSGDAEVCAYGPGQVSHDHAELMSDDRVIADINHLLRGEPPAHCQSPATLARSVARPEPVLQVAVWGDATVTVRDAAGRLTGPTAEGVAVNSIPGATYYLAGLSTWAFLPASGDYTLSIAQTGEKPVRVEITRLESPSVEAFFQPQARATFVDAPSVAGGRATLRLQGKAGLAALRLRVDLDADGVSEVVLEPTRIQTGPDLKSE